MQTAMCSPKASKGVADELQKLHAGLILSHPPSAGTGLASWPARA